MKILCFTLLCCLFSFSATGQNGRLFGTVYDEQGIPLEDVYILVGKERATTDRMGRYALEIPSEKQILVEFSAINKQNQYFTLTLKKKEEYKLDIRLPEQIFSIDSIDLISYRKEREANAISLDTRQLSKIVGVNKGVENLIMSVSSSVVSNNELTTQYSVRGGNFDENLIYVNGVEIYRPFLIRSGQQEGLSFINSYFVENIRFSSGGFNAEYGDKLSSVLDITYRTPDSLELHADASMRGASVNYLNSWRRNDRTLSLASSVRYKSPVLLFRTFDTQGDYVPQFADAQVFLTYQPTGIDNIQFLGNISRNTFEFIPERRLSSFGTISTVRQLLVDFEGREEDTYLNTNLSLQWQRDWTEEWNTTLLASYYRTLEQEFFDINGTYVLGVVDNNPGSPSFGDVSQVLGQGEFLDHARNRFFAQVARLSFRAKHEDLESYRTWKFGIDAEYNDVVDRLDEWQFIDSAGFNLGNPSEEYALFERARADNSIQSSRWYGFAQYSNRWRMNGGHTLYLNSGIRAQYWDFNSVFFATPRSTISLQPNWEKDWIFQWSNGFYYQSPFYREMRDFQGNINHDILPQKSFQSSLRGEYTFQVNERTFLMTAEIYGKYLWDVIPYERNNLQLRYYAENNAIAYVAGAEWRINGEFVKHAQSYLSLGWMRTEELIEGDGFGWIPRPTDQRFTMSLFYQDRISNYPDWNFHLNFSLATGLPFGPENAPRGLQTNRIPAYRRVDMGLSRQLFKNRWSTKRARKNMPELWIAFEIFNVLNINNTESFFWVRDFSQNQFAVPNFLTGRMANIEIRLSF